MVLYELRERDLLPITFVDVAQTSSGSGGLLQRVWKVINGNPYKQLSWLDPLRWKKLLRKIWFRRSDAYFKQTKPYRLPIEELLEDSKWIRVPGVESPEAVSFFRNQSFQVGILAGLNEIVPGAILERFERGCINAHPAPLPECRGGGALEQTLYQGLQPAVSVHLVTEQIDAGAVLAKREVQVHPRDHFDALRLRLDMRRSALLVKTAEQLLQGQEMEHYSNKGPLYKWRDCTREVQANAEQQLQKLRAH
jgi:methionyl-tRNA formyltransferase